MTNTIQIIALVMCLWVLFAIFAVKRYVHHTPSPMRGGFAVNNRLQQVPRSANSETYDALMYSLG